jgi:hypothetical protein
MSRVTIHLWHTPEGQIVAIGRPVKASNVKDVEVTPLSERGHAVFATDVDEHTIEKLHETHVVDLQRGTLVPRDPKPRPAD